MAEKSGTQATPSKKNQTNLNIIFISFFVLLMITLERCRFQLCFIINILIYVVF